MHHPLLTLTQTATPEAAIALQQELRKLVVREDDFGTVKTVAGVDVGFEEDDRVACAAIARRAKNCRGSGRCSYFIFSQ